MALSGPFEGRRPCFAVTVAGHPAAVPYSWRMHRPAPVDVIAGADGWFLVEYLDACLRRKRGTHRLLVYTRAELSGVNLVARAYCDLRKIVCAPQGPDTFDFGAEALWRRDADMVARSHAVVWVGPREPERDPVTLAALLGIEYRVVPVPAPAPEEQPC